MCLDSRRRSRGGVACVCVWGGGQAVSRQAFLAAPSDLVRGVEEGLRDARAVPSLAAAANASGDALIAEMAAAPVVRGVRRAWHARPPRTYWYVPARSQTKAPYQRTVLDYVNVAVTASLVMPLLEAGASPTQADRLGRSAFHIAAMHCAGGTGAARRTGKNAALRHARVRCAAGNVHAIAAMAAVLPSAAERAAAVLATDFAGSSPLSTAVASPCGPEVGAGLTE